MEAPSRIRPWVLTSVVVAITIAAFLRSVVGGWVLDDWPLIAQNPYAQSLAHWQRWFTHDFWNVGTDLTQLEARLSFWRPLISATYAVDWLLGGGSTVMFHVTNIASHAAVALLAFLALRRWLGDAPRATVAAAFAAAMFAVHPAKAVNVGWITGRTDVLCLLFVLIAMQGLSRRLAGRRSGVALEIAGTIGAYLSKEQAVVLPAFVVIELWVAAGRPAIDLAFVRRCLLPVTPHVALAAAYLGARALWLPIGGIDPGPRSVLASALALVDALGRFVAQLFVPIESVSQYGLVNAGFHRWHYVALGAAVLAAGVITAFAVRRRRPAITLAIGLFFVAIAPTAVMISQRLSPLLGERFLYVPSLGVAWLVALLLDAAAPRFARIATAAATVVLAALLALAIQRSGELVDEVAFVDRLVQRHPKSFDVRRFQVDAYLRARHSRRALDLLVELRPFVARNTQLTHAYEVADLATQVVPDLDVDSLRALDGFVGHLIERDDPTGRATLSIPAVMLEVDLTAPTNRSTAARLHALRAHLASRLGEHERALESSARGLESCPTCATFVTMHALVLARTGKIDEALAALDRGDRGAGSERIEIMRRHLIAAGEHVVRARSLTGPAALREYHVALTKLGQWGKAYELLTPYRDAFAASPEMATTFADTAVRAGRPDDARAILAAHFSPVEIDALVAASAEDMGWGP